MFKASEYDRCHAKSLCKPNSSVSLVQQRSYRMSRGTRHPGPRPPPVVQRDTKTKGSGLAGPNRDLCGTLNLHSGL